MGAVFQRWTSGERQLQYSTDVKWTCNTDIQLHLNKGPIGLRIDGVSDVRLSDLSIANLLNIGSLGESTKCGMDSTNRSIHFIVWTLQTGPYLTGNGHQDSQLQLGYD